jgi:integrase
MIELQLFSGMRPGEVCRMRTGDVDTTAKPWLYRPARHKTQAHGLQRIVYLGPRAQAVLAPFLRPSLEQYIFSPAEAEAERRAKVHANRQTPLTCGNRPGTNRRRRPRRQPGAR